MNLSLKLKSTSAIFVRTKAASYNAQIRQDYYNANEEKKDSILQNVFRKIQKKADLKSKFQCGSKFIFRRQKTSIPMVFMTYANVVYSYGTERFAKAAAEIGMDGLILPDVPFEEKEEFAIPFKEHGLDLISLIATTSHERIAMIAKEAEGFGISEPKQAKKMAAQSDEVIVGSAIVKLCEKYGADCVPHISTFVKEMKDAIR